MGRKNIYEVKKDSNEQDSEEVSRKKVAGRKEISISMSRIDDLFVQRKSQLEGDSNKMEVEDMELDKPRATKYKKME